MMSQEASNAVDDLELDFHYYVTEATVSLFYLLQGMETVSFDYANDPGPLEPRLPTGPGLMHLRVWPAVSTTGQEMVGMSGLAVQLAFKGWVADIYDSWERLRAKTRELLDDEGIRPEVDCMGDFRHIRHDLIHSGYATEEHSGKCRVLTWFQPGQRMIMMTDHVLDLLNQMRMLTGPLAFPNDTGMQVMSWALSPSVSKPTSISDEGIHLISVRVAAYEASAQEPGRYMMSCVFSDGIFGMGPVEVDVGPEEYHQWRLDEKGNIVFPSGPVIHTQDLYDTCFDYARGITKGGPGMMGPPARYKR